MQTVLEVEELCSLLFEHPLDWNPGDTRHNARDVIFANDSMSASGVLPVTTVLGIRLTKCCLFITKACRLLVGHPINGILPTL